MALVELAAEVADDLDLITEHCATQQAQYPGQRLREIIAALDVLEHNPLIGQPVANGKRELVIGRRAHGYPALYRHVREIDAVFVLAIRSQREAGYAERDAVE